jgi:limonene-1,2-epoxide hydrolase
MKENTMTALMAHSRDKKDFHREQVVARLFDACYEGDPDRIRSFFCTDSIYEAPETAPLTGGDALGALFGDGGVIERELLALAASSDGVHTRQRVRRFVDGRWLEREVTAVLAVDGCKIRRWRDCDGH